MKTTILSFLLLGLCTLVPARDQYLFSHIRTGRESSNLEINCIFRDSDGFVWFGTSRGLLRYDGFELRHLSSEGCERLAGAFVTSIQEDAAGRLWIEDGEDRYLLYDRRLRRCTVDVRSELNALYGYDSAPSLLYVDFDRNLWLSDGKEVCCVSAADGTLRRIEAVGAADAAQLRAFCRRGERCYLLYASGEVAEVDAGSLAVTGGRPQPPPPANPGDTAPGGGFCRIFVDSRGGCWISDGLNGLWYGPEPGAAWRYFGEKGARSISSNSVRDVIEDTDGCIWIATDHGGIDVYDPRAERATRLRRDPYDGTSLVSNSVSCLYCDDERNIWVGYYKRGVSLYSIDRQKSFTHHIRTLRNRNLKDDISAICEDREGNLWFATDEFGVVRRNPVTGEERFFRAGTGPDALGSDVAVKLHCDSQGRVWIGTYQGGLACYDHGRMIRYRQAGAGTGASLSSDSVWAIEEDCDGHIWLGTLDGGVQRLDPRTGRFDDYGALVGEPLASPYILDMSCRRGGRLYISTVNGIEVLDVQSLRREMLVACSEIKVMNLLLDSRGLLWCIGKQGRVALYDVERRRFLDLPSMLDGDDFRSVIEDDNKNIWLATDFGFFNVVVGADPRSESYTFTPYRFEQQEHYDFQSGCYNFRSVARLRNGEIIFGSSDGYYAIDPNVPVPRASVTPDVWFTGLEIGRNPIEPGRAYDGEVVLPHGIEFADRIDLKYKQNRFALTFASLDYSAPFRTAYYYQLEGFSDDWLPVAGDRYNVGFTNLSPGEYRMRIRALRTDGSLSEDVAALRIVIHPPFWRTTLALVLYAVLLLGGVWAVWLVLLRRQRRKLEQQRMELEIERQNQLNEMKIRFFTNISHDFRTPLTLIVTPVEELRARCAPELRPYVEIVRRNAARLLGLVNQLLDFRKLDVYGTKLDLSHGDFVAFVRDICSSFEMLSEKCSTTLAVDSSLDRLEMDFDKDKVSKVLMNLLSNAFKYTPDGGRVEVAVELCEAADGSRQVAVAVSDTGIGVPDADKSRIFDRFYQVERATSCRGSGIGLHIVREFVTLHGGTISVSDNAPRGSIFRFVLPAGATAVAPEAAPEAAESPEPLPEGDGGAGPGRERPAILLVEDNAEFRGFMRDSLSGEYEIVEAGDGVEALNVLQHASVDVIISDVMMPRMDGLELCKAIKGNIATSHIPLILLTACSMEENEREGLVVGADEYVTKPFNLAILRLRIAKLIAWTKRSHELVRKTPEIHPGQITITSLDERLIENVLKIVEANMDNSEFSVEELSSRLGMHRTHLYKKLTFITGKSPLEFIRIVRLKRAAQLLRGSRMNVSEVAYTVGFNSPKIFARYFKEEFGVSPREYQRQVPAEGAEPAGTPAGESGERRA